MLGEVYEAHLISTIVDRRKTPRRPPEVYEAHLISTIVDKSVVFGNVVKSMRLI